MHKIAQVSLGLPLSPIAAFAQSETQRSLSPLRSCVMGPGALFQRLFPDTLNMFDLDVVWRRGSSSSCCRYACMPSGGLTSGGSEIGSTNPECARRGTDRSAQSCKARTAIWANPGGDCPGSITIGGNKSSWPKLRPRETMRPSLPDLRSDTGVAVRVDPPCTQASEPFVSIIKDEGRGVTADASLIEPAALMTSKRGSDGLGVADGLERRQIS